MTDHSAVFNAHPQYIESLYQSWVKDPASVESDWDAFFKGFDFALSGAAGSAGASTFSGDLAKEFAVMGLIHGYRDRGHTLSTTNPLKARKNRHPKLDLVDYGLSEADLDSSFSAGFELGMPNATLRAIVQRLQTLYCGNIGFESTHVFDKVKREWLRNKIENRNLAPDFGFSAGKKEAHFRKTQRRRWF
jgi:2-oxoglutarate dehydrogenase E1 component